MAEAVRALVAEIGYRDELARLYPDAAEQEGRWQAVEEVVNAVAGYAQRARQPTLAGFLQEVALTGNEQEKDKDSQLQRNAVALMTLHAAKGLEFPEVYMVGMEEGMLPHARSIAGDESAVDEERRLCYVGVTRAQRRLTLTMALSRMKWGKPRPTHSQPLSLRVDRQGRQSQLPGRQAAAAAQARRRLSQARAARRG